MLKNTKNKIIGLIVLIFCGCVCFASDDKAGLITSAEKKLVSFVQQTIFTSHYTKYQLGGSRFDTENGVYILDCSNFVDHVLQQVTPHAYSNLVNATGADTPASRHYYQFFNALSKSRSYFWSRVDHVQELQPGDILVFRYINAHHIPTGGHVMIVMHKPIHDSDIFFVQVADSASAAHSRDTRDQHDSGIGIGTLLLKENTKTGRPAAYAWGVGGYWNHHVNIVMARPKDIITTI